MCVNFFFNVKKITKGLLLFFVQTNCKSCAKKFESIKKIKKREEPAVSKLGNPRDTKPRPLCFFSGNNIFYVPSEGVEKIYLFKNLFERCK